MFKCTFTSTILSKAFSCYTCWGWSNYAVLKSLWICALKGRPIRQQPSSNHISLNKFIFLTVWKEGWRRVAARTLGFKWKHGVNGSKSDASTLWLWQATKDKKIVEKIKGELFNLDWLLWMLELPESFDGFSGLWTGWEHTARNTGCVEHKMGTQCRNTGCVTKYCDMGRWLRGAHVTSIHYTMARKL